MNLPLVFRHFFAAALFRFCSSSYSAFRVAALLMRYSEGPAGEPMAPGRSEFTKRSTVVRCSPWGIFLRSFSYSSSSLILLSLVFGSGFSINFDLIMFAVKHQLAGGGPLVCLDLPVELMLEIPRCVEELLAMP